MFPLPSACPAAATPRGRTSTILATLAAAVCTFLAGQTQKAQADAWQYTFDTSLAGYTVNADYYSATGSFDYDNGVISNAVIMLDFDSGVGTLTAQTSAGNPPTNVSADGFTVSGAVAVGEDQAFADDSLTVVADAPFGGTGLTIQIYDAAYGTGFIPLDDALAVATTATDLGPDVSTPEPASISLLAGALALLHVTRRSARRRASSKPSQAAA